jgi:hypothetical protein
MRIDALKEIREFEANEKRRRVLAVYLERKLQLLKTGKGKQCPLCGEIKHLSDFNKRKSKYGNILCLTCWLPRPPRPKIIKICKICGTANKKLSVGKICADCLGLRDIPKEIRVPRKLEEIHVKKPRRMIQI